jgi:hypothetical protein
MKLRHLGAALLLAGALVALPAQAASAAVSDQPGPFLNLGSGKCVGLVPDASGYNADGLLVSQQTCNGSPAQTWRILIAGYRCSGNCSFSYPVYEVVSSLTNKCLDLRDGGAADGTPVQQWTCTGNSNMIWHYLTRVNDLFGFTNERAGTCLDVAWGSHDDGAPLQGFRCNNTEAQWYSQTTQPTRYLLKNQFSNLCPRINGSGVQQYDCVPMLESRFATQLTDDGSYRLATADGRCLEVAGGRLNPGAATDVASCNDDWRQRWWLNNLGNGFHEIANRRSELCLDIQFSSMASGATVVQYTCNGAVSQHFALTP